MNGTKIDEVFKRFAELLKDRFSKQKHGTEDSIRYTLFYCLTSFGEIHPSDIILEYPHPHIRGAEVDTYIMPRNGQPGFVFEFKFDREIPSGTNPPKTQKAGKVFADIFRLALFKPDDMIQLYFVYVTDKEMATYFQNPDNQLNDFFNLIPSKHLAIDRRYIQRHPNTFVNSVGDNIVDCDVVCHLSREFMSEFWIRVYEIKPANI